MRHKENEFHLTGSRPSLHYEELPPQDVANCLPLLHDNNYSQVVDLIFKLIILKLFFLRACEPTRRQVMSGASSQDSWVCKPIGTFTYR